MKASLHIQGAEGASRSRDSRPIPPSSSQPINSLSSSESAAAISLLALAPGTPPGVSSPSGTPLLQPAGGSGSVDFEAAPMQMRLSGPSLGPAGGQSGQGQAAEPMDSDMMPTGVFFVVV